MTNYEKIKSMSIEEMVKLLRDFDLDFRGISHCPNCQKPHWDCSYVRCIKEWLESEADEEAK